MYIQTRQVANDEKVNLGGYFTSQYIFFSHLTPYLKRKQEAQHKSLCLIKTMQEPPQHRQQQRRYAETGCSFQVFRPGGQVVGSFTCLPANSSFSSNFQVLI